MCSVDKEKMIVDNQGLVYTVLKKYNCLYDEDLFQVGMIGLMKAVELFDESRGAAFSSFACRCIANEILICFRKRNRKSFNDYANTVSYNALINENKGDGSFEEFEKWIAYTPDFDESLVNEELYYNINKLLTPIEKSVIVGYYGLYDTIPIKQRKLSQILNMSQANVSRVIKRAKKKLKNVMEA